MSVQRRQQGFTLIELVVVIVILGILAATALPKFVNMQGDAADAAAQGVAGALSSAAAMNYAKFQISSGAATAVTSGTTTCSALEALLAGENFPANIDFVTATGVITCTPDAAGGTVAACNVRHTQGTAAGFPVTVVCTGT